MPYSVLAPFLLLRTSLGSDDAGSLVFFIATSVFYLMVGIRIMTMFLNS